MKLLQYNGFILGSAIKCFTCNSHFDKGCERSTGLGKFASECDMSPEGLKYTVCRKIDQDVPNHDGSNEPHRNKFFAVL